MKNKYLYFLVLLVGCVFNIATSKASEDVNSKVSHKFDFTLGLSWQVYSDDYREATKGKFYYLDSSEVKLKDIKYGNSFDLSGVYDLQFNITKHFRPFIGVGVNVSFPISKLNVIGQYYTSISNFAGVNLRVGGSFRFLDIFEVNVYANGGFTSAIWLANGASINVTTGIIGLFTINEKVYLDQAIKFGYVYMYGGGVDFVIRDRYTIGLFYARHIIVGGQESVDDTAQFENTAGTVEHRGFVDRYNNHTIGIRFGLHANL